ncbi:hypothetical protein [Bacillus cereus]
MKPLAVGLLASNVIAFGSQSVSFAATDKEKVQEQKQNQSKKANPFAVSFAATDGEKDLSDLAKALNEVLKGNGGKFDVNTMKKIKEKAAEWKREFDYVEYLKALTIHAVNIGGELADPATGDIPVLSLIFSPLVETLFPHKDKVDEMWEALEPRVEALIDEKLDTRLTKDKVNELKTVLAGSTTSVQNLLTVIMENTGHGDQGSPYNTSFVALPDSNKAQNIEAAFKSALDQMDRDMAKFKQDDYEIFSLPLYV